MKREEKAAIIENLKSSIEEYNHFYLADISELNAEETSVLRSECFKKDIKLVVSKNTLMRKALEGLEGDYEGIYEALKGSTSVMFCNTGNVPAKLIKELSKKSKHEKPELKGAYVEESIYLGKESLEALVNIKSKEELIGDIIGLLQSPMKNVVSALQSGGGTIHGILQTLSERE